MKKTQDPIIVTPPKPLPIPSPTFSLEEGSQGTSEAEVVTEPKARFVGSTHEEIPEWPGPYHITENGLYECAGYEFSTDLLVEVAPKGLTEITIEENGVYKPDDYDGYSKVTVDVFSPTLETLNATENKTYTAPEGKAYDEVVVNVPSQAPTLVTKTITANGVYNASSDNADGYSSVNVSVQASWLPTLYAPTTANGSTAIPLAVTPNTNNGAFVSTFAFTVNEVDLDIGGAGLTSRFVPWIYSITPLVGGTFEVSCKCTGAGFNDSTAALRSVTIPSATETTGYVSVTGLGSSDPTSIIYTYDANFPRSFQEVQDTYGNVFIKIPTMYRKILASSNGQITSYALATSAQDSDYKPYPCFVDETNNNAILPFVLIGVYCISSTTTANSVEATAAGLTIADARTLCHARGTGYQQYDWKFQKLFTDLGVVLSRFININSGQVILYETMGIKHQNNFVWVDGVCSGSTEYPAAWYVCEAEANYQNGGGGNSTATTVAEADILSWGYVKLAYSAPSATEYIGKLGYDTGHPFLNYPDGSRANVGSNYTFYCDQFYYGSGCRPVGCAVGITAANYGWFFCGGSTQWGNTNSARLCYRPILNATGYTE